MGITIWTLVIYLSLTVVASDGSTNTTQLTQKIKGFESSEKCAEARQSLKDSDHLVVDHDKVSISGSNKGLVTGLEVTGSYCFGEQKKQ